jgi:hypothetical protein
MLSEVGGGLVFVPLKLQLRQTHSRRHGIPIVYILLCPDFLVRRLYRLQDIKELQAGKSPIIPFSGNDSILA